MQILRTSVNEEEAKRSGHPRSFPTFVHRFKVAHCPRAATDLNTHSETWSSSNSHDVNVHMSNRLTCSLAILNCNVEGAARRLEPSQKVSSTLQ